MTVEEYAEVIIGAVMGSPQFEESDREVVIQKLKNLLKEAATRVCMACKARPPQRSGETFVHSDGDCPASGIWNMIGGNGEEEGAKEHRV